MNKQTKKLAEQAGFVLWPDGGPFGEVIDWASSYDMELEKFAELIRADADLARVGEVGVWGDKREWVGLTDEEIDGWNIVGHESLRDFVRAIEAKLKEKNCG